MDTKAANPAKGAAVVVSDEAVAQQLDLIKQRMPLVYGAIKERAADMGKAAYGLVRRGLRGEANCFYAFEKGHVVGTPFAHGPITAEAAALMVQFGAAFVCFWPGSDEVANGAA